MKNPVKPSPGPVRKEQRPRSSTPQTSGTLGENMERPGTSVQGKASYQDKPTTSSGFHGSPLDPDLRPRNIEEFSPIPPPVFSNSCHSNQLASGVEDSTGSPSKPELPSSPLKTQSPDRYVYASAEEDDVIILTPKDRFEDDLERRALRDPDVLTKLAFKFRTKGIHVKVEERDEKKFGSDCPSRSDVPSRSKSGLQIDLKAEIGADASLFSGKSEPQKSEMEEEVQAEQNTKSTSESDQPENVKKWARGVKGRVMIKKNPGDDAEAILM